jgi:hypothetical protein
MYRKVRIKKLPQARTGYQVQGSLANDVPAFGGADYNAYIGKPNLRQSKYITAVPRDEANLEAEGGETVFGDINGDGFPEHKIIKGPRHSNGGVPLSLPDDTFIFSDTKSMKINDPNVLQMFGKAPKKGKGQQGFTPADLAKQYDIDKYRKVLQDPDSDHIARKTAELMIRNYNMKLGALALAQEAKKGFPQGIPVVAKPYMEAMGLTEEKLLPAEYQALSGGEEQEEMPQEGMQDPQEMYASDDYDVENTPYETEEEMGMQPGMGLDQAAMEGQMQMPMAMYGMAMGGYDLPFYEMPEAAYGMAMGANSNNYMGRTKRIPGSGPFMARDGMITGMLSQPLLMRGGGYLPKAQTGPTPKYKTYKEEDLPAGTTVKDPKDMSLKVGDYVRQADGTVTKVTSAALKVKVDTQTLPGTRADFMNASADNKSILEAGDKIIDKAIASGQAVRGYKKPDGTWVNDNTKSGVRLLGDLNLPFEDRIILSRALNSSKEFGTGKYKVESQAMTKGYSRKVDGKYKGSGSFVSGFTPEDYEKRYLFEKARGFGLNDQEAFDQINKIYADPAKTSEIRKEYLNYLGKGNLATGKSDADLLNPNFYKANYNAITEGIEQTLGQSGYRPTIGDEQLSGFEHFDAAGLSPEFNYEPPENPCPCKDDSGQTVVRDADGNCPCPEKDCPCGIDEATGNCKDCDKIPPGKKPPVSPPAKWWLQDTIKTTGAFGDLMGIKKYMPWSPKVDLEEPRPTFLDPTRELAQQSEQANLAIMNLAAFAGPQALSSRASSIQGTGAKSAADTLSRINNANVGIADNFEMKQVDIRNQEALANQAGQQKLYDANTIANQQFDNSRMALRNQMRNHYTNAITNKAKTAALNQLYPQFAVDPSTGGMPAFKDGKRIKPEVTKSTQEYFDEIKQQYPDMDDKTAYQMAKDRAGSQTTNDNAMDIVNAQYNVPSGTGMRYGGFANGGFVYGDSIFPFFFT